MKEKVARLAPPQESMERTKQGKLKQNKKQETHPSMNKSACMSHSCSRTINNSMYDNDLSTTTSALM